MPAPYENVFTPSVMSQLFPPQKTNLFFEALFGDAEDGAYDIRMSFLSGSDGVLNFLYELHQRGNACLACNLTHGLPHVFERHPVIDAKGTAQAIARLAGWEDDAWEWQIGSTEEISTALHVIPLRLKKRC